MQNSTPTYFKEPDYDEEGNIIGFNCPFSDENVYEWDEDTSEFPEELIYYHVNLLDEPIYCHPDFVEYFETYCESEDLQQEFESFDEYLISILPNDDSFFRLIIEDNQGATGDFLTMIYKGFYKEEIKSNFIDRDIPIFDGEFDLNEEDEMVFYCPLTGDNTYEWDLENDNPPGLIYIYLFETQDLVYVHPDFRELYDEYKNGNDQNFDSDEDFIISHLDEEKSYFKIDLREPSISGDHAVYLYEGVYE